MSHRQKANRNPIQYLVFLGPVVIVYSFFMIFPLFDTMRLSLFAEQEDKISTLFVGLDNYKALFGDDVWSKPFWNALKNNFIFFVINMGVQNTIALLLTALITLPRIRGSAIYRTLIFLPAMLSFVIVGFVWKLILSPLWGITENAMYSIGLGEYFAPWLGLESSALITVSLISIWQFIGVPMLLIYAAFLNIPNDIYEAAYVDGASNWAVFWRIKFPLIFPTLGIVTILTFVANFNAFDLIYVIKGQLAGPAYSTDILGTFFYRVFFGFQMKLGDTYMGATIASIMFLIIFSAVVLYFFSIQRRLKRYEF